MNDSIKLLSDILTRFLTTVLGAWLLRKGFSQEDAAFITGGGAVLLVSLVYSIYRNFALRNQTPPAAGARPANQTLGSGSSGNTLLILLIPVLMLMGCNVSPAKQVTYVNQTLTTTLQLINDARSQGLITQQQVEEGKPYVDAAVGAARAATHAVVAGEDERAKIYMQSFWAANDELLKWRARVLKRE